MTYYYIIIVINYMFAVVKNSRFLIFESQKANSVNPISLEDAGTFLSHNLD